MTAFIRARSASLLTIVGVLLMVVVAQAEIFLSISFGRLEHYEPSFGHSRIWLGWIVLRGTLIAACIGLWLLNRKRTLVRTIVLTNGVLTVGLILNVAALSATLMGFSARDVSVLLVDVLDMAASNILIFSVWYWLIDPPGIDATAGTDRAWEFLFPQRASRLPSYEVWTPGYLDYVYLSFTTTLAFSPTDVLPLTQRAKMLMLLQATASAVTLTCIVGSAINVLAGGSK
jgi:hypothetical protein